MNDLAHDPAIRDMVERLRGEFDPCTIWLFGSRAKGEEREWSDYDVMVVVPQSDETHFERHARARQALRGWGQPIDVIVYTQEEWDQTVSRRNSLSREVVDTGIRLHAA